MTWRLGQSPAFRAPVAPVGATAPMPPVSQPVERRTERPAGRTGPRWGLRALVVGGLAGAAWLLTGAAAHAADRAPTIDGLAVGTSLVAPLVSDVPDPTGPLRVADRPPGSERLSSPLRRAVTELAPPASAGVDVLDVTAVRDRVETVLPTVHGLTRTAIAAGDTSAWTIARTVTTAVPDPTDVDSAAGDLGQVVRELAGPRRLTGGPSTAPPTVTDLEPPDSEDDRRGDPTRTPDRHRSSPDPGGVPTPVDATAPSDNTARRTPDTGGHEARASGTPQRASAARPHPRPVRHLPDDRPASPVQLGTAGQAGGSAPTDGGSTAVLPGTATRGAGPGPHLPSGADVGPRQQDAGAPTVSPD